MSDVDRWRETASTLRELAKFTVDAEAKCLLLTLVEDCEQLSGDILVDAFMPRDEEMIRQDDTPEGNVVAFRAMNT